ncbi:MAG: ABC transporter ATP-binding protein [Deltaproteobacteria bacterium]|nr:MAG: ABC transporter ATP-binding protein [Deltaproteobacteria bacterium]
MSELPLSPDVKDTENALLSVQDLKVGFWSRGRWVNAVDGISIHVGQGEGLAVIGESGSGKTLSMMSSLSLIPPNPGVIGGSITYKDGEDTISLLDGVEEAYTWKDGRCNENPLTEKWRQQYRRRAQFLAGLRIGIIFQNPISSLDPLYSVGGTLMESIRLRNPSLSRWERHDEAVDWLERVHIQNPKGVMNSYPHQLSGGMCQRVMIAATLAMRPRIIIADEPTTGLDMTTKAQILYLLHEARTKYGSSLIFVTHEIGLVTGLTERVVVMRKGHVVDHFPTARLSDVTRVNGELQLPDSFAEHTSELLTASLKLEGDEPLGDAFDELHLEESDESEESVPEGPSDQLKQAEAKVKEERANIQKWQAQHTWESLRGTALASVFAGVAFSVGMTWYVVLPALLLWWLGVSPGWKALQSTSQERRRLGFFVVGLAVLGGVGGPKVLTVLALLMMWVSSILAGHHVLESIHKHRLGYDRERMAWMGKWLGVVLVPVCSLVSLIWL